MRHPPLPVLAAIVLAALWGAAGPGCIDLSSTAGHWELRGAHLLISCESCHPEERGFEDTPTRCIACHEDDKPPGHYDGDCDECHGETSWGAGVVDHDFLPLDGAHAIDCEQCHIDGDWSGLSSRCSSCHEDERPEGHFGDVDCEPCHRPTVWGHGEFDHDPLFPLPHRGVDDCSDCHLDSSDYSTFSCIDCHAHRCSEMDDEHDDESGYECSSDACLDCHPDGRE